MKILFNNEPHEVLEAKIMFKGRGHTVVQSRVKNLATGSVTPQSFHPSDIFEEIELKKFEAKFLYAQLGKNRYFFCEKNNPAKRFDLGKEQIGETSIFLTPNKIVEAIVFEDKIINIVQKFFKTRGKKRTAGDNLFFEFLSLKNNFFDRFFLNYHCRNKDKICL